MTAASHMLRPYLHPLTSESHLHLLSGHLFCFPISGNYLCYTILIPRDLSTLLRAVVVHKTIPCTCACGSHA
jgi:hypothetical protein